MDLNESQQTLPDGLTLERYGFMIIRIAGLEFSAEYASGEEHDPINIVQNINYRGMFSKLETPEEFADAKMTSDNPEVVEFYTIVLGIIVKKIAIYQALYNYAPNLPRLMYCTYGSYSCRVLINPQDDLAYSKVSIIGRK